MKHETTKKSSYSKYIGGGKRPGHVGVLTQGSYNQHGLIDVAIGVLRLREADFLAARLHAENGFEYGGVMGSKSAKTA